MPRLIEKNNNTLQEYHLLPLWSTVAEQCEDSGL